MPRYRHIELQSGAKPPSMSDPTSPSNPTSPRVTLKLKSGPRKPPAEIKAPPPAPRPQNSHKQKPGAHWSDEFKERMQADMDALTRR